MKYLIPALLALMLLLPIPGCSAEEPPEEIEVIVEETPAPLAYDPDVNYMAIMILCAADFDTPALREAITTRNAKIVDLGLDEELLTVNEFLREYRHYAGFDWGRNYLEEMKICASQGNFELGRECAYERNLRIRTLGLDEPEIDFDDMYLLAKIITNEAGSNWLPMEWKMAVGEVLLNRVASPEFPDTIEECAYQPHQYSGSDTQRFANMIPYEDCIEAAARLLSGERVLNEPSVVFQANFKQGSGVFLKLTDKRLGNTYLCYSNRRELYEQNGGH